MWKFHTKHSIFGTTSIYGNHDESYYLLPFSFNLKIIFLISLHQFALQKCTQKKDTSPNSIEFSKNQTKIGRFVWFQKPYKRKIYFEPCFQLLKINDLGQHSDSSVRISYPPVWHLNCLPSPKSVLKPSMIIVLLIAYISSVILNQQ